MKVMKFGGGCLKNSEDVFKVADIIRNDKEPKIVVVSAVSGVTNMLEESLKKSVQSEQHIESVMEKLGICHLDLINKVISDAEVRSATAAELAEGLHRLKRYLTGVAYTEEITPSIRANVMSFGERFSAMLLAGVLNSRACRAVAIDADAAGIITDESFDNATARIPLVRENLSRELVPFLERGIVPVLTGYFGCTTQGKVTTFGRNGSDYSAAVVARALDATALEIWKDVDGFMSADPKVVKNARPVERLSYFEAAELSYFGAKILHPRTVEPLVDYPIPVIIRNIHQADGPGTAIVPERIATEGVIKSITSNRQVAVLRIYGPGVGFKPGIIAEIGRLLSEKNINIFSVLTSQTCINLLVDKADSQAGLAAVRGLVNGIIENVELRDRVALVAVVGEGMLRKKGIAARCLTCVANEDINIEMLAVGASEVAQYFVVAEDQAERAIHAIHQEFFGSGSSSVA